MDIIFPGQPTTMFRQWCLVYDTRDGHVVHIHEFIALDRDNACSPDELAQQALSHVVYYEDPSHLQVLQLPAGMRPDPSVIYRVNLKDEALQVSPRFPVSEGKPGPMDVVQRYALILDEE